jgi:hypothetical protein
LPLSDFVRNFDDMSTSDGYQFKFRCDICGDGYVTKWRDAPFAKAKRLLGAAQGVGSALSRFGGSLGGVSGAQSAAGYMQDSKYREGYERAFDEAVAEARGHFTKCPACAKYVDATCWNEQTLMCVQDSPRETVVVQKARAGAFGQKAQEAVAAEDFSAEIKGAEEARILCPSCGKPTSSGKFCEACGAPLTKPECPKCGAKLSAGARFCNNCGTKLA